jgi:hypothetical protein
LLFGAEVTPENVIGETASTQLDDPAFRGALSTRIGGPAPTELATFRADPVASWIETTFGLDLSRGPGRLRRAAPRSIAGRMRPPTRLGY